MRIISKRSFEAWTDHSLSSEVLRIKHIQASFNESRSLRSQNYNIVRNPIVLDENLDRIGWNNISLNCEDWWRVTRIRSWSCQDVSWHVNTPWGQEDDHACKFCDQAFGNYKQFQWLCMGVEMVLNDFFY